VATNEPYFAGAEVSTRNDALLCIADGAYVAQDDRRKLTPEHRFKTAAEMRALFKDLPEACDNTLVIAQRCAFMLEPVKKPTLRRRPRRARPASRRRSASSRAQGLDERLRQACGPRGMDDAAREAAAKPYRARLDYELAMIVKMGFDGYFLIVADFIQWAKAHGIPVGPGRGSGAARSSPGR